MEYSCKCLRKTSMVLSNGKQVMESKMNKMKNTSTEEEILYDLEIADHSLQPSTLEIISKRSTGRKRVKSVSNGDTQCKCIKISDEIKKSICTMSKKEESLLGKIKLMIDERMNILNNDFFNKKLEILHRRVEQVQLKKNLEETTKTFLEKISKFERCINAVMAIQEEVFSQMAVHQANLPSVDYQNTALNQPRPSAFCPDTINTPTSSLNALWLSPYTDVTSAYASEYLSSDEVILVSVKTPNSPTANNSGTEIEHGIQAEYAKQNRKRSEILTEQTEFKASVPGFLKLREETSDETVKQFPPLPPLPRIPLCPELAEEFKDPPQNSELKVPYVQNPLSRTLTEIPYTVITCICSMKTLVTVLHHIGRRK